jgi:tetratricopeptide (TPR) repeat protein
VNRTWARVVLGVVLVAGAAGAVALYQQISAERHYRRLVAEGEAALAASQTYVAIEAFSGALAFRPDSMVAYLRRGEAYRAQGRNDEAVRDWREAIRLAPDAPQPLIALGDLFDQSGDFGRASEWYGQAAERLGDQDPALLYKLALARYRSGEPGAAIAPLARAVARPNSTAEAHYLLGLLHRDTGNPAAAVESLKLALTLAPSLTAAREELADVYRSQGRTLEEMAELQILARDDQAIRQVAIGLAEARQGQLDAALGTLSRALGRSPNDSRLLLAIGRVHLARAERDGDSEAVRRAIESLEQALGGRARRSEGLALYGRALYLAGEVAEAERILREAVATSPVHSEAFAFLADAAERLGHHLIARDALMNLDAIEADSADAATRAGRARRIGELAMLTGDPKIASTYLSRVVDPDSTDAATMGLLAEARWRLGQDQDARALLDRALKISPRDPKLLRLSKLMRDPAA